MSELGDEKKVVRDTLVEYAVQQGWQYLSPTEASQLRGNPNQPFLEDLLAAQLLKLNPDFMTPGLAREIIHRLHRLAPGPAGNHQAWKYLTGSQTIYSPEHKREFNITILHRLEPGNNLYHVTKEYIYSNNREHIRQDIVFFINGLPLLFAETKSPSLKDAIEKALAQVSQYHDKCPELLTHQQIYSLTHIIKYYYSATWNTSTRSLFNWKTETPGDFETQVKLFYHPAKIINLLVNGILFTRKEDELVKVILRPHQLQAVERIEARCADPDKKRGLIWHTQGSGKTYTMIVAAQKILRSPLFRKPTVLMLIDRTELQFQLQGNLAAVGFDAVETASSGKKLQQLLAHDTRGLIVSMIHKFDGLPANLNIRDNIFILVDEAHRTTGGTLGNYLLAALPNATLIGFTGTPIDQTTQGKGTFITFGPCDQPEGYLHKYSIAESIHDHTTVPLHYTFAPNELQVDKETLDREFFQLAEAEGITDIEQLNRVLERAVTLRNMLKEKGRLEKVARYVVDHFKNNIQPLGYKAFLVAVDREACALYKQELDKLLPPEASAVIYSPNQEDNRLLRTYHLGEEKEKRLRKEFRKPGTPLQILVVTEKLLTGYDAPILYCLYLDKPMRDHALLQAIARVNRPYENPQGREKSSGLVVDFVGVFDHLEKALKFDSRDIEGVLRDLALLKHRFSQLMETLRTAYLPLLTGTSRDKRVETLLLHFLDDTLREEFYQLVREIMRIYDILSPDEYLRSYIDDYELAAEMYALLREKFDNRTILDREFSRKTARLVQEHTHSSPIRTSREIYEIDEHLLKKLAENHESDTEQVFNLVNLLESIDGTREPYLIPIGEKASQIAERFKERQEDTAEALEKLKKLIAEVEAARKERAAKNMSIEVFTVYWSFKQQGLENPEAEANSLEPVFRENPHYKISELHRRQIRQALYIPLVKSQVFKNNIIGAKETAENIIKALVYED